MLTHIYAFCSQNNMSFTILLLPLVMWMYLCIVLHTAHTFNSTFYDDLTVWSCNVTFYTPLVLIDCFYVFSCVFTHYTEITDVIMLWLTIQSQVLNKAMLCLIIYKLLSFNLLAISQHRRKHLLHKDKHLLLVKELNVKTDGVLLCLTVMLAISAEDARIEHHKPSAIYFHCTQKVDISKIYHSHSKIPER